jgi:predicted RNA-binding protein YlqC (UPF0109 family)
MKTKVERDPLVKRVDALLALTIVELLSTKSINVGQIYKVMHHVGLTPDDIGKIVGRKGKDISATITMHEKIKRKQHG